MNMDILEGKWKELRGKVQQRWGELTDNDLDQIAGRRVELEGMLQKRYGYTKERARQEVDTFYDSM
jgi:uncharacterized protein YjbJ (UPF0337 family)